jgi:hypothetical protein
MNRSLGRARARAARVWLGRGGAFALPLTIYLLTLAPTITWAHDGADGGDLITAAYTLGVPHPPGYPTYCLLGWLFTRLPLRGVAWRLNLMSAVAAGLAAVALYEAVLIWRSRGDPLRSPGDALRSPGEPSWSSVVAGLAAAWGVAFVPVFWSQALIAEVYAVNAAFVAGVLWLALRVRRRASPPQPSQLPSEGGEFPQFPPVESEVARASLALGLVWGLSLGVHLTGVALLPLVMWGMWAPGDRCRGSVNGKGEHGRSFLSSFPCRGKRSGSFPYKGKRSGSFLHWFLGAAAGFAVYLYLPLRAGRGAVTWGDPSTLVGWWWVVSGALYRGYVFSLPLGAVPARLLALARYLVSGFGPTGVVLGVMGLESLARRRRGFLLVSALSWLMYVAYSVGYDTADSYVYLIPAFIISAFWLGQGLAERLHGRLDLRWGLVAGLCLTCIGPLSALAVNYGAMDVHRDVDARTFGREVLAAAPQGAILLSAQDAHTFTLWYFQRVLGRRSDVAVVDTGLLGYDWYRADLARAYPKLIVPGDDTVSDGPIACGPACCMDELIRGNPTRPICEVIGEEAHWLRCAGSE